MPNIFGLILTCVIVVIVFSLLLFLIKRYKKCPSDKVMVIYGKVGSNKDGSTRSAKCIHGGAAFIWPVIQSYEFLDLTPMSISVDLENALSRQNIRINVPSRFTVGVSTEPGVMQNAAERLLGLKLQEIQELAKDIIFGQLRLVIATMDIEEINTDRDKFLEAVSRNVEGELKKIGLRLINVNVTDISDESGYIDALGKEAAAKAINDAKKNVAEKDRDQMVDTVYINLKKNALAKNELMLLDMRSDGWGTPAPIPALTALPELHDKVIAVVAPDDGLLPAGVGKGQVCYCDAALRPQEGEPVLVRLADGRAALLVYAGRDGGRLLFTAWEEDGTPRELAADEGTAQLAPVVLIRRRM